MLCGMAIVNGANCAKMGGLGRDVITILDAAGARRTPVLRFCAVRRCAAC